LTDFSFFDYQLLGVGEIFMELWLQQHWVTLTGGGLSLGPGAIWLYRRLRFEHLYVAGNCWAFEYRRPGQAKDYEACDRMPLSKRKRADG
jgi:hypothetical protein